MANMFRCRAIISGVSGLPGVFTAYFNAPASPTNADADEALKRVRLCLEAVKAYISTSVVYAYDTRVATLDPANGQLVGSQTATGLVATTGTGAGNRLPPATQAYFTDVAGAVLNGRALLGRHNVAGMIVTAADAAGVPVAGLTSALYNAGTALRTVILTSTVTHVVWHRQILTGPHAGPGLTSAVGGTNTPGKFAVLRSRRD